MRLKLGEWKLVLPLLGVLAINTLVLEIADVVATSGFVSKVGPAQVPWLWLADMAATLLLSGFYALVVDRMSRVQLVGLLLGGAALAYLVIQSLLSYGAPEGVTYFLLYILSDQQLIVFPLAFWALANDMYTPSEAKRLFPVIAAGSALGSIVGNSVGAGSAVVFARLGQSSSQLLSVGAALLLTGAAVLWLTFRNRPVRARQSTRGEANLRGTLQVGMDFFRNVPLFTYLAVAMLLMQLALTFVEYHFLYSIDRAAPSNSLLFQTIYSAYKVAFIATMILFQWLVVGRFLDKVGLKNTFLALPFALLLAASSALALPGFLGGAIARFVARLVERGWDEPSRKSLQNLIPDERRGRVGAFLDSYFYAVATMAGCVILLLLLWLSASGRLPPGAAQTIYLGLAGLASLGAIWAAFKSRAAYEASLLDWRLARPRRRSVLDGIEF